MDFTSILKTVAPWIATALGGPLGGLAVDAATQALGIPEKSTEALKKALTGATPEDMLKLKEAEQAFVLQMQALGYKTLTDLENIAAGDRKDARDMQKTTRSKIPATLSIALVAGYFGILGGMMYGALKVSDSQALLMMLGSLTTGFGTVLAYWFGTTRDSSDKTQLLAKAQPIK